MSPLLHSICSFPSTAKSLFETKPKPCFFSLSHLTKNPTISLKKQVRATCATLQDENEMFPQTEITTKIKHVRVLEAYQLFQKWINQGRKPTPSRCKSLVFALCDHGMFRKAVWIVEFMLRNGVTLPDEVCTLIIKNLITIGAYEYATQLLDEMEHRGCNVDPNVRDTVTKSMCREVEMFEVVDKYNVQPNSDSYNKLVLQLCKGGNIDLAINALEKMVMKGYEPTECTYVTIIEAIGNLERKDKAEELLRELHVRGEVSQESMEKISLKLCLGNVGF